MSYSDKTEDPHRRQLIKALAAGVFSAATPFGSAAAFDWFGSKPKELPKEKSIYKLSGTAAINGKPASDQSIIRPGDTVETGKDSQLIFVVGGNSMILRSDSHLVIEKKDEDIKSLIISGLRLLKGKILSVSRNQPMRVRTHVATIGIRGTGWYAESDPEQTYFCTCYGTTEISANKDNESTIVSAQHHDQPLYILGDSSGGKSIREAPLINHTDQELALIEALVGRTPPFVFPKDDYSAPRRDY